MDRNDFSISFKKLEQQADEEFKAVRREIGEIANLLSARGMLHSGEFESRVIRACCAALKRLATTALGSMIKESRSRKRWFIEKDIDPLLRQHQEMIDHLVKAHIFPIVSEWFDKPPVSDRTEPVKAQLAKEVEEIFMTARQTAELAVLEDNARIAAEPRNPIIALWRRQPASIKAAIIGGIFALLAALIALVPYLWPRGVEKAASFDSSNLVADRPGKASLVPDISVKVANSGEAEVAIHARGELVLWLASGVGAGVQTIAGKYELFPIGQKIDKAGLIVIKPGKRVSMRARILNQEYFSKILKKGETNLSLIFRSNDGSIFFSEDMPFTEAAIGKYYLPADASKSKHKSYGD